MCYLKYSESLRWLLCHRYRVRSCTLLSQFPHLWFSALTTAALGNLCDAYIHNFYESAGERILKIGPHLPKLLNIKWLTYLVHSVLPSSTIETFFDRVISTYICRAGSSSSTRMTNQMYVVSRLREYTCQPHQLRRHHRHRRHQQQCRWNDGRLVLVSSSKLITQEHNGLINDGRDNDMISPRADNWNQL